MNGTADHDAAHSDRRAGRAVVVIAQVLLALGVALPAYSQSSGRIIGRVLNAETGAPLPYATVQVTGREAVAQSAVDGRFVLSGVPAGAVSLSVRSLGYGAKTVTGVIVPDNGVVEQNISLVPAAIAIAGIEVSAGAERGSVNRALDQQRTSSAIVNSVTAEQMSRSPDGDAAGALQRVSGVTVQEGKFVFVRGLGERYTTTSLNGARIPSPEPERKVVPLDMFPSGLLQTITTTKTFTPDQPGDFSGASVDITTREFPAERQFKISTSVGLNDQVTGSQLFGAPMTGSEWTGAAGAARSLPSSIASAGNFTGDLSHDDFNGMINEFRNAWSPKSRPGRGSSSMGMSLGGTDELLGQNLSYLLSGTYSVGQEARADQVRARAITAGDGSATEVDRFTGTFGNMSVAVGGLANLSALVRQDTRMFLNTTFNRTSDNEARFETGTSENHGGIPMQIERLRFIERTVATMQLGADHGFGAHRIEWRVTASNVERDEPDRSEFVRAQVVEGDPYRWFAGSNEGAVRTFGELSETAYEANGSWRMSLGSADRHHLKVGGLMRLTERDATSNSYSISAPQLPADGLTLDPEQIFDGRFTSAGQQFMRVTPLSQGGSYSATDNLAAGFAMLELGVTDRVTVIGGARVEQSDLDLQAQATIGNDVYPARLKHTDVLPSVAVNIGVTDQQNVRLSATQTLARPEYREMANVMYREVIGGDNVIGNPDLERTLIRNLDARWEWYPEAGEVLSLGVFFKHFDAPIERVYRATSGTSVVSFVNADNARNYGVELELRKRLGFIVDQAESVTLFSNVTVMRSEITVPASASSQTNTDRAMVGQAPYVVNAGLTWAPDWRGSSATLLYNVVGDRIMDAGEIPLPDVIERARNILDFSLRTRLHDHVSARFDAKNLLDAANERRQGDVTRETYRSGRTFSFGLSWGG